MLYFPVMFNLQWLHCSFTSSSRLTEK